MLNGVFFLSREELENLGPAIAPGQQTVREKRGEIFQNYYNASERERQVAKPSVSGNVVIMEEKKHFSHTVNTRDV
ncbi:MAG TPA: hypothetical protein VGN34_25560 [Ktedonobacteraceae bacterium]|jgi:hypothetical protein